jgi:hypothetical protein
MSILLRSVEGCSYTPYVLCGGEELVFQLASLEAVLQKSSALTRLKAVQDRRRFGLRPSASGTECCSKLG